MTRLVVALCLVVACASSPPTAVDARPLDAPAEATVDASPDAAACGPDTLWQYFYACGCCTEGQAVCIEVVVDMGVVVDVVPAAEFPPSSTMLACIKTGVVGHCFAGDPRVCVYGI